MTINGPRFREIVQAGQRFLLTSHRRADCDALGSELGMAAALDFLGKQVVVVNGDVVPNHLRFMDPKHQIKVLGEDVGLETGDDVDVIMVLDTSSWSQLGPMGDLLRRTPGRIVVIDHHVSEDDLGAECFKDTSAESTGRLVVEAIDALGVPLSTKMATSLFAAVATDTGWFRFSSVTGETHRVVARLIDAGARPEILYRSLYEDATLSRLLLRGRILGRIRSWLAGRLLTTQVRLADFEATGAHPAETDEVINALLTVAGSEVAAMFVEQPSGKVKVSLRSRGVLDMRKVVERFGGGGHVAAAGATMTGSLATVEKKILDALREVVG